jgi:hypothetical protein
MSENAAWWERILPFVLKIALHFCDSNGKIDVFYGAKAK